MTKDRESIKNNLDQKISALIGEMKMLSDEIAKLTAKNDSINPLTPETVLWLKQNFFPTKDLENDKAESGSISDDHPKSNEAAEKVKMAYIPPEGFHHKQSNHTGGN